VHLYTLLTRGVCVVCCVDRKRVIHSAVLLEVCPAAGAGFLCQQLLLLEQFRPSSSLQCWPHGKKEEKTFGGALGPGALPSFPAIWLASRPPGKFVNPTRCVYQS
jgi:hypothetical protein